MRITARVFLVVALFGLAGHASGFASTPVRAAQLSERVSSYDPYTGGATVCPQGNPAGGPKCKKVIPRSHPLR